MKRHVRRFCLLAFAVVAACGTDTAIPTPDAGPPPTYTELYTKYFAVGTPGHCAMAACHADSSNGWTCGTTKDMCYAGMVSIGIISTSNPQSSAIGDPANSPLRWINPNAIMPFDAIKPFPEGRDAIIAWVKAGAQNN